MVEAEAILVAVGNTRSYGGGMLVVPGAKADDGLLDVMVGGATSRNRLVRLMPTIYKGTYVDLDGVDTYRSRTVRLHGTRYDGKRRRGAAGCAPDRHRRGRRGCSSYLCPRPQRLSNAGADISHSRSILSRSFPSSPGSARSSRIPQSRFRSKPCSSAAHERRSNDPLPARPVTSRSTDGRHAPTSPVVDLARFYRARLEPHRGDN